MSAEQELVNMVYRIGDPVTICYVLSGLILLMVYFIFITDWKGRKKNDRKGIE